MSYDGISGGLTPLEQAAGLAALLYGPIDVEYCPCGDCDECKERRDARNLELGRSAAFKEGAKLVAGLSNKREIKLALVKKLHLDNLDRAIVRYMRKESLPKSYADLIKNPHCIETLVEGIFYKICRIQPTRTLSDQIKDLSSSLRGNPNLLLAYNRVTQLQQFIHRTVDEYFWVGAALSIPVMPMKNALSAARLHLNVVDVVNNSPAYVAYIDNQSKSAAQLEYEAPYPSTAPNGKRSWPRWRVRHLQPLSYFHSKHRRSVLQSLADLDERVLLDEFVHEALLLYASARE